MAVAADHVVLRIDSPSDAEVFGNVLSAISGAGGEIVAVQTVTPGKDRVVRDVTAVGASAADVAAAAAGVASVSVVSSEAASVREHDGGVLTMRNTAGVATRDDLSMAYTPGVARVCMAIHEDFEKAWEYTIKGNSLMVVSDGSDVVGLGDLGPLASLPACEAVCAVLRQVGGVDAFPLPIDERDLDVAAGHITRMSSVFAGVHLTSMTLERGQELAEKLGELLDIPVLVEAQLPREAVAGLWKGTLAARARAITPSMVAAATELALGSKLLDESVAQRAADAVATAARGDNVARR